MIFSYMYAITFKSNSEKEIHSFITRTSKFRLRLIVLKFSSVNLNLLLIFGDRKAVIAL